MSPDRPPTDFLLYVGRQIRLAREEAGLSQRQLARLVGVSQTTVLRWEAGTRDVGLYDLRTLTIVLHKDFKFFLQDPGPDESVS